MTLTDSHIKLRQATSAADLETIHDLILRAGLSTERAQITATLEGSTYWIAELNGVPGGCIGLEHGQPGVSLIRSTVVIPEARSQGLGRALAQSALTQAILRGDHTLYLFSTWAGAYWQRFGFVPVDVRQLAEALPDAPQVKGGLEQGWLYDKLAWKLVLRPGTGGA